MRKMCCDIKRKLVAIVVICLVIDLVNSSQTPADKDTDETDLNRTKRDTRTRNYLDYSDEVQNYLMNFGYLPKSDIETGNLRSEDQLRDAIRNLQRIGNLPQTGVIDEETAKLIRRPRCGVPDVAEASDFLPTNRFGKDRRRSKRYVILGPKWDKTDLTWSLRSHALANYSSGQMRRVFHDALNVWAKNSRLTFRESSSEDADIQVLFARRSHGDGYDFDGPGNILAHAYYPGAGRGGDAHFDEEEKWLLSGSDPRGTNLMGVAVHEFGHSLGLGHSSVQDAIMFPWYHNYETNQDLPEDDRIAIQQIYGSTTKQWGRNPPRYHPPTTTSTTTTTTTTTPVPTRVYYPGKVYPKNPDDDPKYKQKHNKNQHHRPRYPPTNHNDENVANGEEEARRRDRPDRRRVYTERPTYQDENPRREPTTRDPNRRKFFTNDIDNQKPDTCDTSYDAISIIRGQLFIFKGRYLWRFGENGLIPGYPHEISRLWKDLPKNFTHIDTVYENKEMRIVFFIGRQYYVFNSDRLEPGYPKPLTHLGLPHSVDKIDAALVWGHNNRTYFYSGILYWRFDEETKRVELDYPRDMSMWRGIGYNIDSAFQWTDGKTYFFKGKGFWKFNDYRMKVEHERPRSSAQYWMGCPKEEDDRDYFENMPAHRERIVSIPTSKSAQNNLNSYLTVSLISLHLAIFSKIFLL